MLVKLLMQINVERIYSILLPRPSFTVCSPIFLATTAAAITGKPVQGASLEKKDRSFMGKTRAAFFNNVVPCTGTPGQMNTSIRCKGGGRTASGS